MIVLFSQVPLADEGQMLVSQHYLRKYLVDFSNEKMHANWDRTHRFAMLFEQKMLAPAPQQVSTSDCQMCVTAAFA